MGNNLDPQVVFTLRHRRVSRDCMKTTYISKRKKKKNVQMIVMYRRFHCHINLPDFWNTSSEISSHACVWKTAKHTLVIVVVAADNEKKNSIDWRKQTDKQSFRQSYIYFYLKQVRTIKNVRYITIMSWLLSVCTSISTYQLLSIYLNNINKKRSLNHNLMSWLLTTSSNLPTSWFT